MSAIPIRPHTAAAAESERVARTERRLALFESVVLRASVAVAISALEPHDDPAIVYVNEAFSHLFGYAPSEVVGRGASVTRAKTLDPYDLARVIEARRARVPITLQYPGRRKGGERFWCEATISPIFADDGTLQGYVSIMADVTARTTEERLAHDRGNILEAIASDAPLASVFAKIVASAERSSAGSVSAIALRCGEELYLSECGPWLSSVLDGRKPVVAVRDPRDPLALAVVSGEARVTAIDASLPEPYGGIARRFGIGTCLATPIRHSDGEIVGAFARFIRGDVAATETDRRVASEFAHLAGIATERRRDRERLEFLAHHDTLTGLPNRILFEQRAALAIALARSRGTRVAIGTCDLDRFKLVNDSLGHAAGDLLLRDIGVRLARTARRA